MLDNIFAAHLILSIVFALAAIVSIVAIIRNRKKTMLANTWGCFLTLAIVVLCCSIAIIPVGTETYSGEVTILRTENIDEEWFVYFEDGGTIRSVRCSDTDKEWFEFVGGETVLMDYGRVNNLIETEDEPYSCFSISKS